MRLKVKMWQGAAGSVLLVALGVTFLLGLGLASYLTLARQQNVSVARSHAWNAALAMAEAGVEESLAHINQGVLISLTNLNRTANGWTFDGTVYRAPRRNLQNGYYDAYITGDAYPVIYATGYVNAPFFAEPARRALRVTTATDGLFVAAMAARLDIDFKGFGVETDSFDSSSALYSTDGKYDPTKNKDNGDVATTMGLLNVGNAKVMGTLRTGPEGNIQIGAQGSVGDQDWVDGGTRNLQPGHYLNDFNVDFPDVMVPFTSGLVPQSMTIDGTNCYWVLENGDYVPGSSAATTLPNKETILVTGKARLYIPGDFTMVGSSQIVVASGGSLAIYVGGANTTITKINVIDGNCANFNYFGLPSNESISMSGNDAMLATIYAPSAVLTLSGGGSDVIDYQGACVAKSIKLNGHFKFHYDENLAKAGPLRAFVAGSWTEL